jgi:hypothetical protein
MAACSAGAQRSAIKTAWDNDEVRHESFEATLQSSTSIPSTWKSSSPRRGRHPATLEKFLDITSRELAEEPLARQTADRLVAHPPGLRSIMIETMDAAAEKPDAKNAIAQAMESRPERAAAILIQRDGAMRATFRALIDQVANDDRARRAFIASMRENSTQLATLMARDPAALGDFVKALLKVGVRKVTPS